MPSPLQIAFVSQTDWSDTLGLFMPLNGIGEHRLIHGDSIDLGNPAPDFIQVGFTYAVGTPIDWARMLKIMSVASADGTTWPAGLSSGGAAEPRPSTLNRGEQSLFLRQHWRAPKSLLLETTTGPFWAEPMRPLLRFFKPCIQLLEATMGGIADRSFFHLRTVPTQFA